MRGYIYIAILRIIYNRVIHADAKQGARSTIIPRIRIYHIMQDVSYFNLVEYNTIIFDANNIKINFIYFDKLYKYICNDKRCICAIV